MAKRKHIQRGFGAGEISEKLMMRGDASQYQNAALEMTNFMPTPQGTAKRMPGTQYLYEVPATTARIIPYLAPSNERALLLLTETNVRILLGIMDAIEEGDVTAGIPDAGGTVTYRRLVIKNGAFQDGDEHWTLTPGEYYGGKNGDDGPLGCRVDNDTLILAPRFFKYNDAEVCTAEAVATIGVATDVATFEYFVNYVNNAHSGTGGFEFKITVSENSDYTSPIYEETYDESTNSLGDQFIERTNITLPTAGWTGTLYVRIQATARENTDPNQSTRWSGPQFNVRRCRMWANGQTDVVRTDLTSPYTADDLRDIHYVQSPYQRKELVLTHPKHAPQELFFQANYQFAAKSFSNQPTEWELNNYPASCTSYHGRLILGGAQSFKTAIADPLANVSETVWGTEVGSWNDFTASAGGVNPDDSIQFTAIYRSPIQWVFGGTTLLVGALELEYSASGDGIFSPGDLGVKMQSTHGSNNVQPAGFGEGVLFPSDGGVKVRSMTYSQDKESWVAKDLTLLNPTICQPRIVRMARCRNPHQMCLVLLSSGDIAIFNSESGMEGWCRYRINNGAVKDLCVAADENGVDVPFLLVRRIVDGTEKLYLECIPNFTESGSWSYQQSSVSFQFDAPTNIITGLDHLEGQIVQVASSQGYVGFYYVVSGQVTLADGNGDAINVTDCTVGLQHRSVLRTLPVPTNQPGAMKSFPRLSVRVLSSTRPIINGQRPEDRDPSTPLGTSQPLDAMKDVQVSLSGYDKYASVEISEHLPLACEVLGLYGEIMENET